MPELEQVKKELSEIRMVTAGVSRAYVEHHLPPSRGTQAVATTQHHRKDLDEF